MEKEVADFQEFLDEPEDPEVAEAQAQIALSAIAGRLISAGCPPGYKIAATGRRLLVEASVMKIGTESRFRRDNRRVVAVFNDHILIAKPDKSKLSFKSAIDPARLRVSYLVPESIDVGEQAPRGFQLLCPDRSYILIADDITTKNRIMDAFYTVFERSVCPTDQLRPGWIHTKIGGTIHSACIGGSISLLRRILRLSSQGHAKPAAATRAPSGGGDDSDDSDGGMVEDVSPSVLNAVDLDGFTGLQYAALYGHAGVLVKLLRHNADVTTLDPMLRNPLHIAVAEGHVDVVNLLLAQGLLDVKRPDMMGFNALMLAVRHPNRQIAQDLVVIIAAHDKQVNVQAPDGLTPAHVAVLRRLPIALRALLQHGADVVLPVPAHPNFTPVSAHQTSPLHVALTLSATMPEHVLLVQPTLTPGGDDTSTSAFSPQTGPPDNAVVGPFTPDIVELLLQYGSHPNRCAGPRNMTPLHAALQSFLNPQHAAGHHGHHAQPPQQPISPVHSQEGGSGGAPTSPTSTTGGASSPVVAGGGSGVGSTTGTVGVAPGVQASPADAAVLKSKLAAAIRLLMTYGARLDIPDDSGVTASQLVARIQQQLPGLDAAAAEFREKATFAPEVVQRVRGALASSPLSVKMMWSATAPAGREDLGVGVHREKWEEDNSSPACKLCRKAFGMFQRRHHCRQCGILCCQACSSKQFPLFDSPGGAIALHRACDGCFNVLHHNTTCLERDRATADKERRALIASKAEEDKRAKAELMAGAHPVGEGEVGEKTPANQADRVKAAMDRNKVLLAERGERLSKLEDNSAKLADSAGEFEAMCKKLAQQQGKRGWFG